MVAVNKTIDIDRGEKEILRQVAEMKKKPYVKVGILGNAGNHKETGTPVVLYAGANEFGTKDGRVPERSFIRSTMDQQRRNLNAETEKLVKQISQGRQTVMSVLKILGLSIQSKIRKKITTLSSPPNRPSTIAKKGSSNPLIDTGQMRSSINFEVVKDGRLEGSSGGI